MIVKIATPNSQSTAVYQSILLLFHVLLIPPDSKTLLLRSLSFFAPWSRIFPRAFVEVLESGGALQTTSQKIGLQPLDLTWVLGAVLALRPGKGLFRQSQRCLGRFKNHLKWESKHYLSMFG